MLVIFLNTGGLTGAEGGVAVGTTVLAQRLLESVFGDEAVRRLAETAKNDLDARVEGLMASEFVRFSRVIDQLPVARDDAEAIRQAIAEVERDRLALPGGRIGTLSGAPQVPELTSGTLHASASARMELSPVRGTSAAEVLEAELVADDDRAGR